MRTIPTNGAPASTAKVRTNRMARSSGLFMTGLLQKRESSLPFARRRRNDQGQPAMGMVDQEKRRAVDLLKHVRLHDLGGGAARDGAPPAPPPRTRGFA